MSHLYIYQFKPY